MQRATTIPNEGWNESTLKKLPLALALSKSLLISANTTQRTHEKSKTRALKDRVRAYNIHGAKTEDRFNDAFMMRRDN